MLDRFILIHGKDPTALRKVAERTKRKTGFASVVDTADLILLATPCTPIAHFARGDGVVVGTLFHRAPGFRRATGQLDQTPTLGTADAKESLIRNYWGNYLAVSHRPGAGAIHILRAPMGSLPCYYLREGPISVFSSDVATLVATGCFRPRVNWDFVRWHLASDNLPTTATGLEGLIELAPGTSVEISTGAGSPATHWSPWDFVTGLEEDFGQAAETLRGEVRNCVRAWSTRYDRILLTISGGLDSSIVAACLGECGADVTCLTFATDAPSGDEREYARIVAQSISAPLVEGRYRLSEIDLSRSFASHLPRPGVRGFEQGMNLLIRDLATRERRNAYFHGLGGDSVFSSTRSATPLVDRFLSQSINRGLLRTLDDITQVAGCSTREALVHAARRLLRPRTYRWTGKRSFLNRASGEPSEAAFSHPWLTVPEKGALPGKAVHIAMILGFLDVTEDFSGGEFGPMIGPLLSQPVVEQCLHIPSWLWIQDGRDRAVARSAFRDLLPASILDRRWKGSPSAFSVEVFEANRRFIRDFLGDGLLARNGIINACEVLEFLRNPAPPTGKHDYVRINTLVDMEAWARSWESRVQRP